jgi:hypothetical protein
MTADEISKGGAAPADRAGRLPARRLWLAGLLAAVVAAVANLVVFMIERMVLGLVLPVPQGAGGELAPLPASMVVGVSVVAAIGATLLLAILRRFVRQPLRWFQIIAALTLLLSFGGPFWLPADVATKVGLGVMHVVAAATIVGILRAQAGAPER